MGLRGAVALLLPAALALPGGCGGEVARTERAAVSREAEGHGVSITLSSSSAEAKTGENVRVRLEVVADATKQVGIANYGHALTEEDRPFRFRVVRSQEEVAKPAGDGKRRWVYMYDLEFSLADRYELPAATVSVAAEASGPDAEPLELKTESLPISVVPAVSLSAEDLKRIRVLDPRELPWPLGRWWVLAAVFAMTAAALLILMRRRRRRAGSRVVIIPAHEWAYRELSRLMADRLVEGGRIQEFFYRISGIVRGYIERRFEVTAPEMTTEEFLEAMSRDARFSGENRRDLTRFLNECDLVKYARYEATALECEAVASAARAYVDQTKTVAGPSPGSARPRPDEVRPSPQEPVAA